ncbi:MAG: hypothetical protein AAGE88_05270 [Actinomycetota bacterium]
MATEESHEQPEVAELRKPPLNAPQDASRPAAAGRHDIVEEADAGGLWSEVDGLLTIDFSSELANLSQADNYLAGVGPEGLDPSQIPLPPEMAAAAEQRPAEPPPTPDPATTILADAAPLPDGRPPTGARPLADAPPPAPVPPSSVDAPTAAAGTPPPSILDAPTPVAGTPPPSILDGPPSVFSEPPPTAPPRPAPPIIGDIDPVDRLDPVETIEASAFTFEAPRTPADDDTVVLDAVVIEEPAATSAPPRPTPPPTTIGSTAVGGTAAPGPTVPGADATRSTDPVDRADAVLGLDADARLDPRPAPSHRPGPAPVAPGSFDGRIDPLLAPVPVSGAQNFDFFREATGNQVTGAGRSFGGGAGAGFGAAGPAPRARSVEPTSGGFAGTDKVRDIIDRRLFAGVLALLGLGVVGFAAWFVTTQFGGEGNRSEAVLEEPPEATIPRAQADVGEGDPGATLLPPTTFAITTSTVTNTAPPPTQPRPTAAPTTGGGTTASSAASTATTTETTAETTTTTRRTTTSTTAASTTTEATTSTTEATTTTPSTAGPTTTADAGGDPD